MIKCRVLCWRDLEGELGLFFAGGKGKASRKTPNEIIEAGDKYGLSNDLHQLQQVSRLVAKVDSAAVQDGYQLYHHFFIFDQLGNWAVIQQGLNERNRYARRYHWLSENLKSFVEDPHKAVCGLPEQGVLNLVSTQNEKTRLASVELCHEHPNQIIKVLKSIHSRQGTGSDRVPKQLSMFDDYPEADPNTAGDSDSHLSWPRGTAKEALLSNPSFYPSMTMPAAHAIPSPHYLDKILYKIYDKPPESFEQLLQSSGVGPSTLRALAMVAEVTHAVQPSFTDPVRYSFAHGGKDNYPFPVQRQDLNHSLQVLRTAIEKGKIGHRDKLNALKRLAEREEKLEPQKYNECLS